MLESSDAALASEDKLGKFKLNMIFYWIGAVLSLSLLAGAIGWSYKLVVRDINQIPIVRAQLGPLRVAPDNPGGLTAANQGLSVTQLAVNEKPLSSDEINLAPAAEILNEETSASLLREVDKLNQIDETYEIKEINAENTISLDGSSGAMKGETASKAESLVAQVAFSQKKVEIENAVSLALSITSEFDPSLTSLRPKTRPRSVQQNRELIVSKEPMSKLPIGSAIVQLGAFDSKSLAESEWRRFEKLLGSILAPKQMIIQKAESGGKIFYRLRAAGFNDISDARQFCTAISDKVACIPVVTR
ncbi:MAG: SPOR domain-containing protein [Paracoccaceae bacterium]|nr:SPOR domain-containing protein [Paracoccaceae bacterium]